MQIEFLSPESSLNPENDNPDVVLRLDDGRIFKLLVATPNNIYWCMDNDANDYYFGAPPLLLRRLTRRMVEAAVLALLPTPWFDTYAILQTAAQQLVALGY